MRARARGDLVRLLPGVYGVPEGAADLLMRAAALGLADPDAVVTGRAAARLTWWPELASPVLTAARSSRRAPARGYAWEIRRIPPELILRGNGIAVTHPALTVLDLVGEVGGQAIDEARRRRATTLADMRHALELTPGRAGNPIRRDLLDDSRDQPWSEAERILQRLCRALSLPWPFVTNHPLRLPDGSLIYLDVAFLVLRLYLEADGYAFHGSRGSFESDRDRDSALGSLDWVGFRFSASFLAHRGAEAGRRIEAIVRQRARLLGLA